MQEHGLSMLVILAVPLVILRPASLATFASRTIPEGGLCRFNKYMYGETRGRLSLVSPVFQHLPPSRLRQSLCQVAQPRM